MIHLKVFKILIISLSITSVLWAQKQQANSVVTTLKVTDSVNVAPFKNSYPVVPFQDTLFFIHNKIGGFSPEKRAKAIADRIRQIYSDPLFEADSLKIVPADITLDIVYKDAFIIMSITTQDAKSVGEVIEKTALVVRVRTPKMEDITIPNATVLSSSSINFSANTRTNTYGLVIHSTVTIGYDVPWREVHKALIEAANRTDLIEKEPKPFVLQTSLDDFYVSYEINAFTKEATKQPRIYSNLHQNIQDCFNEAGIEIMSPHYKALRDGNRTTIPESYLSRDYQPSVFQVKSKKE